MLHKRNIAASLAVANTMAFCADADRHTLDMLRERFQGRCHRGAYIVSVDRLVDRSSVRITKANNSGDGELDVVFEATAAVVCQWDVVPAVRVRLVDQALLGETTPPRVPVGDARDARVVVNFRPTPASRVLRAGQVVFARAVASSHMPAQPQASVVGVLFTCDRVARKHGVAGTLAAAAAARVAPLVAAIDRELALRAELPPAAVHRYERLLYAYSGDFGARETVVEGRAPAPWRGPAGLPAPAGAVHFLDLVRDVQGGADVDLTGVWSQPLALHRSCPLAGRESLTAQSDDTMQPEHLAYTLLHDMHTFLFAVRCMVETYDEKAHAEHANVWAAMRAAQQAPPEHSELKAEIRKDAPKLTAAAGPAPGAAAAPAPGAAAAPAAPEDTSEPATLEDLYGQ